MIIFMKMQQIYEKKIQQGLIQQDEAQMAVLEDLEQVGNYLEKTPAQFQAFGRSFKWVDEVIGTPKPKGLYFYGSVGRGKSMLMDLFFQNVDVNAKRRVHFHEFMGEVHERMHAGGFEKGVDPVHKIAMDIARDARLLCFDEFYISNIADAMMLGRLFEMLMKTGVMICTTSNWAPENLFQGGHNRILFKPFIKIIENSMNILPLGDGKDWRTDNSDGFQLYFTGEKSDAELADLWRQNYQKNLDQKTQIMLENESFEAILDEEKACYTSFKQLCGQAFASEQFLELSKKCSTVFVEGVPEFDIHMQDEAMRFVVMVDIFYEKGVTLVISAQKLPQDLCPEGESAFAFERTASRLHEMQKRPLSY